MSDHGGAGSLRMLRDIVINNMIGQNGYFKNIFEYSGKWKSIVTSIKDGDGRQILWS